MLTLSKEDELLQYCKELGTFSYVDIMKWKPNGYYLRADRTIRDFVTEGKLRRISDEEALLKGLVKDGNAKIAHFEFVSL